jgi:hypothetical protein
VSKLTEQPFLRQSGFLLSEPPSLSFDDFLVFLCAFASLRIDNVLISAELFQKFPVNTKVIKKKPLVFEAKTNDLWFQKWQSFMNSSHAYKVLMEEQVFPILQRETLLAFPEDARLRDRFSAVFSLQVLLALEGAQDKLQAFFRREKLASPQGRRGIPLAAVVLALKHITLVPTVLSEEQAVQLIHDVLPQYAEKLPFQTDTQVLLFPQVL